MKLFAIEWTNDIYQDYVPFCFINPYNLFFVPKKSEWRYWNNIVDLIEVNNVANEKIHIVKEVKVFSH